MVKKTGTDRNLAGKEGGGDQCKTHICTINTDLPPPPPLLTHRCYDTHSLKKLEKDSACRVALITMTLRSCRRFIICFTSPNRTSVKTNSCNEPGEGCRGVEECATKSKTRIGGWVTCVQTALVCFIEDDDRILAGGLTPRSCCGEERISPPKESEGGGCSY